MSLTLLLTLLKNVLKKYLYFLSESLDYYKINYRESYKRLEV